MFCSKCGVELPDNSTFCAYCGTQQAPSHGTYSRPAATPAYPAHSPAPINSHLTGSILVTLFCCLPFGIVAIINASRVSGLLAANRIAEAAECSAKAATWMWWAFGLGLAAQIIGITINVLAAVAEAGAL